ncbi:zinc finger Ran-binding domain-containing protein 2-like isoform X1 [Acropora palmata]|uniref:zinc finger Ran-binding domain-containing protein 2-like isoform X1 n=2 Tax=Acropora palmata TaxID=6131 RepID=UPI003DA04E0F
MSSKLKVNNGDWVCPDKRCGNVNFARRTSCNRCGKDKGSNDSIKFTGSQIGKQAAAKSKGLFSADDWMCSKCGNVNWARRSDCNMCGHPKFSKVEQRTGYGGGYNEREGVEYIKRDDSDDEFDEFGRRRKSKHGGHQPALEPKVTSLLPQDEEEEDSDEDGDLSKYNLDDEDDDDEEDGDLSKYALDESDTETKDKGRRSRSRSQSPPSKKKRRSDSTSSSSSSSSRSRSRSSRSDSGSRSRSRSSSSRSRSKSNSKSRSRSRSPRRSREKSKRSHSRSRSRSH